MEGEGLLHRHRQLRSWLMLRPRLAPAAPPQVPLPSQAAASADSIFFQVAAEGAVGAEVTFIGKVCGDEAAAAAAAAAATPPARTRSRPDQSRARRCSS